MILLALALLAQDVPFERDPWDGLKTGSWVKIKTTRPASTEETKLTLTDIQPDSKRITHDLADTPS